jgi:hypothetical protein
VNARAWGAAPVGSEWVPGGPRAVRRSGPRKRTNRSSAVGELAPADRLQYALLYSPAGGRERFEERAMAGLMAYVIVWGIGARLGGGMTS